jgi:hypothetical protein
MPKKQTREAIEAELSATETERLIDLANEISHEAEEVEALLRQMEKERGLPDSSHAKPLVERMARLGMSQAAIDRVSEMFDAETKIRQGKMDELPNRLRQELAKAADAEISALDQLQDILDARRGG